MPRHHSDELAGRWPSFSLGRQLMMIANEINRAGNWIIKGDPDEARLCYERALELMMFTIGGVRRHGQLRELCRAKMVIQKFWLETPSREMNAQFSNTLIALSPESWAMLHPAE
ncbi:MAG: hypothetical protein GF418_02065 [Chitinivibrionales bacterium]|nr:hypothetical protein [Chitinivibrionales bacterium]MBD3394386.1 hypothetical protein [Chitinivibrionales bacterium]